MEEEYYGSDPEDYESEGEIEDIEDQEEETNETWNSVSD